MLKTILEETFRSPKQGGILGSWPPRRALAKGRLERAQTGVVPGPGDEPTSSALLRRRPSRCVRPKAPPPRSPYRPGGPCDAPTVTAARGWPSELRGGDEAGAHPHVSVA